MFKEIDNITDMVSGLSARQKVISINIANAHTPGYVRQEETFTDVLGRLKNPYETDLSAKMGSVAQSSIVQGSTGQPVNMAQEMINMQENFLFYSITTRRLSAIFNNIRKASQIGR